MVVNSIYTKVTLD